MLYKDIKGRLGNQLFQYATMRSFQKQFFDEHDMYLSFKLVEKKAKKEKFKTINSLEDFNTKFNISNVKLSIKQRLLIMYISSISFFYKYIVRKNYCDNRNKIEKKYKNILLKNNIIWKTTGYEKFDLSLIDKNRDIYFYGYFESPKFFNNIKSIILEELTPKMNKDIKNKELYSIIENENSVCVSIRRGDFVSNKKYRNSHYVCDEKYFELAIKKMNKMIENPKYIIFSDDIEWVKKNMKIPKNSVYEDGTDPVWEKLRLMYSCKHFIISNSSFSWWAQYLSRNDNKVVIAPKVWNLLDNNKDIYEDSWILI